MLAGASSTFPAVKVTPRSGGSSPRLSSCSGLPFSRTALSSIFRAVSVYRSAAAESSLIVASPTRKVAGFGPGVPLQVL